MTRRRWAVGIGIGTILLLLWLYENRPWEHSETADVAWSTGGEPNVVTLNITDVMGHPLPGLHADTLSNSGWAGNESITDENGVLRIRPGELDVIGIKLEGVQIMHGRFSLLAEWGPNVRHGLVVDVRVKDARLVEKSVRSKRS